MSKIAYSHNLAKLKSYASRGDEEAAIISAMLDNIRVVAFTQDAEGDTVANTIRVSCQLTDMDGTPIAAVTDILVTSVPGYIVGVGQAVVLERRHETARHRENADPHSGGVLG